jgi:hypothetical protein
MEIHEVVISIQIFSVMAFIRSRIDHQLVLVTTNRKIMIYVDGNL